MIRSALTLISFSFIFGCGGSSESYLPQSGDLSQARLEMSEDGKVSQPVTQTSPQNQTIPAVKKADIANNENYSCWREEEKNPASRVEIQVDKNQNNSWSATYKTAGTSVRATNLSCRFNLGLGAHSSYCFDQGRDQKSTKTYLSAVEKSDHIEVRLQSPELKKPEVLIFALGVKNAGCNGLF